jgi:hypothetical protein
MAVFLPLLLGMRELYSARPEIVVADALCSTRASI